MAWERRWRWDGKVSSRRRLSTPSSRMASPGSARARIQRGADTARMAGRDDGWMVLTPTMMMGRLARKRKKDYMVMLTRVERCILSRDISVRSDTFCLLHFIHSVQYLQLQPCLSQSSTKPFAYYSPNQRPDLPDQTQLRSVLSSCHPMPSPIGNVMPAKYMCTKKSTRPVLVSVLAYTLVAL